MDRQRLRVQEQEKARRKRYSPGKEKTVTVDSTPVPREEALEEKTIRCQGSGWFQRTPNRNASVCALGLVQRLCLLVGQETDASLLPPLQRPSKHVLWLIFIVVSLV